MSVWPLVLAVPGLLALDVRTVEATEGGPVVLDARLMYVGQKPMMTDRAGLSTLSELFVVEPPIGWFVARRREIPQIFHFGTVPGERTVAPGETIVRQLLVLHKLYEGFILPGRTTVRVTWRGHIAPAGDSPTYSKVVLRTTAAVDVGRFTPAVVDRLSREVDQLMAADPAADGRYVDRETDLVSRIARTTHSEFVPAAMRLMDRPLQQVNRMALREFVVGFPQQVRTLDEWDVARLEAGRHPTPYLLAGEWAKRERARTLPLWVARRLVAWASGGRWSGQVVAPAAVSDEHLGRLRRCSSVWVRGLVSVTFTCRLEPAWIDGVARELADRVAPVPVATLSGWLAQLDATSWRDREAAERLFLNRFEQSRGFLAEASRRPLSPEARVRVERILSRGTAAPDDPFAKAFLGSLSPLIRQPVHDQMLRALTAGDPGCRATKGAVEILSRR